MGKMDATKLKKISMSCLITASEDVGIEGAGNMDKVDLVREFMAKCSGDDVDEDKIAPETVELFNEIGEAFPEEFGAEEEAGEEKSKHTPPEPELAPKEEKPKKAEKKDPPKKTEKTVETDSPESAQTAPIKSLIKKEPFVGLFNINPKVLADIVKDIESNGFDSSKPIDVWDAPDGLIVVDGFTRLSAAHKAGLKIVPIFPHRFKSEKEAILYAKGNQVHRRNLSDAELLNFVEKLDEKKVKGGPKKDKADKGRSSVKTAKELGVSAQKVEKARTVASKGTKETKEAVKAGTKSLNKAYQETVKADKQKKGVKLTEEVRKTFKPGKTLMKEFESFLDALNQQGKITKIDVIAFVREE